MTPRRKNRLAFGAAGLAVLLGVFGFAIRAPRLLAGQTMAAEELLSVYRQIEALAPASFTESSSLPMVKKDRIGQTWAIWEEWEEDQTRIKLGRFQNGKPAALQVVSRQRGFSFSPSLAFDWTNSPWAIWINYRDGEYRVLVQDIASRKTWLANPATFSSVTTPGLLFDQSDQAWAFWNETDKERGEIVYRVLVHKRWSERKILEQQSLYPALNPDAVVDDRGAIWAAWSSYDGKDYEIFLSQREGNGWQREIQITDNEENDGFPALGLAGDGALLISWTQSSGAGNQVCYTSFREGATAKIARLSPSLPELTFPRVVQDGQKAGLAWKEAEGVRTASLSSNLQDSEKNSSLLRPAASPILNPSFAENRYVCFGDSITYGYIDRLPAPELGYPPRLDLILDQNFGPTDVINEGIGGEATPVGVVRIDAVLGHDEARYFLVMEGTNDVISNNLSMDTTAFNLKEMVKKCLQAGAYPVIATILPRKDWLGVRPFYENRILALNEKIRDFAAEIPVAMVDMFDIFNNYPESEGGLLSLLSNDKKHPSERGYQVMAESWSDEIRVIPFPPAGLRLTAKSPSKSLIFSPGKGVSPGHWKRLAFELGGSLGNLLSWEVNPKIFDPARIKGYNIYRKNRNVPASRFRFLAYVPDSTRFLDPGSRSIAKYIYAISAVRTDGVEGPCAETVE